MPTSTKVIRLLLTTTLLVAWGCGLSRHAPPQRHYVLGEASRPDVAGSPVEPGGPVIGLRPPRVAAYLETPHIVVRRSPHRVGFSEFHRWGESLARGISRAVAGHLEAGAPSWRIEIAPWRAGEPPDYVVQLHILRFEGVAPDASEDSAGEARLSATWEITRLQDGARLSLGTTDVREPGWTVGDFDGLVSRLDRGVATLAGALRADLDRVLSTRASRTSGGRD